MAFTSEDLTKVQDAIIKLAEGKRVVSYTIAGRTMQFSQAQMKELQDLRDSIQAEISASGTTRRFVLTSTDKGL